MTYNYGKLKGRIVEKCGTQKRFAELMSWAEKTNTSKLNNKITWTQDDIMKACNILDIPTSEIENYFFNVDVQSVCTNFDK